MKIGEIFSFLFLINNSVTIRLSRLPLGISAITSSNGINIFCFSFGFYSSIFLRVSSIPFERSTKVFEPFKYFNSALSLLSINNILTDIFLYK